MVNYTGFIYEWSNKINGKKYIGSHYGTTDDGYIGSGVHFKRAYARTPENFQRTILEYCTGTIDELHRIEEQYLTGTSTNPNYYNISESAGGGYNHGHLSPHERKQLYKKWNDSSIQRLSEMTPLDKSLLAEAKRNTWHSEKNKNMLKTHSENTRIRRLKEEATKSPTEKAKFKETMKNAYWSRPVDEIKDHHRKQSEGVSNWHQSKSPLLEQQRIEKMKETKAAKKAKFIYKYTDSTIIRKQVAEVELATWLSNGWSLGFGPRN